MKALIMFAMENTSAGCLVGVVSKPVMNNLSREWDACINSWLTWLTIAGLSPSTIRLRRDHLRSIARRSGTRHPRDLTLNILIDSCAGPQQQSNDHRRSLQSSCRSFCAWALANGHVDVNVAELMPRVKGSPPHPRPVPDDVWEALLAKARPRERLMARLAAEAGLRRAEVAATRADDLVRDGDGWSLIVHGKGSKQRVVPVTDGLAREVRSHTPYGFLFPDTAGSGHLSAQYVGLLISRLMPPGWSMHKLRHRFATKGYNGTRNLLAVQQALGHASVATTQRYTAVSSREVRSVSEAASAWNIVSA
jgi:integrase